MSGKVIRGKYGEQFCKVCYKVGTLSNTSVLMTEHRCTGVCELERFANILNNVGFILLLLALFQQLSRLFLISAHLLLRFSTFLQPYCFNKSRAQASVPDSRATGRLLPYSHILVINQAVLGVVFHPLLRACCSFRVGTSLSKEYLFRRICRATAYVKTCTKP